MGDDAMRDSSRNESPRGLGEQGRGERQDNNGAEKSNTPEQWMLDDAQWFETHPRWTYRARRALPGEWPEGVTHIVLRCDSIMEGHLDLFSAWPISMPPDTWDEVEWEGGGFFRGLLLALLGNRPMPERAWVYNRGQKTVVSIIGPGDLL